MEICDLDLPTAEPGYNAEEGMRHARAEILYRRLAVCALKRRSGNHRNAMNRLARRAHERACMALSGIPF